VLNPELLNPETTKAKSRQSSWLFRFLCGGILPNLLGAASRNHSSDCAGAKAGQFNSSVYGDRFRPVSRFFRRIDPERLQNAVVQNKHATADYGCLQRWSLA
jgi:hypothetical protein